MDSISFLQEALQYEKCPEGFDEIYQDFCFYQQLVVNSLIEFARVCKKTNIEYQLGFGSLLGIIRDGGQIPWDYDADVFIHFEDRLRLIEALNQELDSKYYFTCGEIHQCKQFFIRIAPKRYNTDVVHVDVFYYIGLPNDEKKYKAHTRKIRELINAREFKVVQLQGPWIHKAKMALYKIKYLAWTRKKIIEKIVSVAGKYSSFTSPRVGSCNSHCGVWFYPIDFVSNSIVINTEIGELMIPDRYESILKQEFHDYRKFLPIQDRIHEVIKSHKHLKAEAKVINAREIKKI